MDNVCYARETGLAVAEFIDVLQRSGLSERRPVNDRPRIERMLALASLVITARDDGRLVGVSRALTDFSYCCYLSDLAVDRHYQRHGIGKRLIAETRAAAGTGTTLILVSAPDAAGFYDAAGLSRAEAAFILRRDT